MPHADFVHLRVHSAYSLSEGAVRLGEIAGLCRAHDMPAVAVTDSGNLFGALEFASTVAKAGIQPIVGCILPVRRDPGEADARFAARAGGGDPPPDQLVLLVQNARGYRNLLRLVSAAFLETEGHEAPCVPFDLVRAHADGLIALTGGPGGAVGRWLLEGQGERAERALRALAATFPGRLYVELMRHGMAEEDRIEAELVDLAYRFDLPLVATNDVFFPDASMYEAHDALMCIAQGKRVEDEERRRLTPEHRFKSAAEMRALFADLPEAVDNTLAIARRCAFMPMPHKPILPDFAAGSGRDEAEELRRQATDGLRLRLVEHVVPPDATTDEADAAAKPYRDRLAYELDVIVTMGFPGYFLIVAEFIQWAKEQDIPVGPGRGSGAGSVVAWALTITDLDPLRFGLLFERFLNPERVSMPDFDVDFCQDRRDEVIRHVQERYGHDRVAQIITFGKLQARACIRDVGRVLGMPYGQVDRISKLVPNNPANPVSLQQAIDGEPQLQEMRRQDETVARLIDIALKLEGLYRHASTHAAGVVIGDRPLDELIPLYRDPRSDMPVTQFNMKYAETAGLVKFDFLGLKTLTVLVHALKLIERGGGPTIDLLKLPLDDEASYKLMSRGETAGVFQLEGSGMRDMLKRLQPNRFEDIIAVVALYRPGPMDNIPSYINRKHGREKPDYLYPTLESILRETYGIIIYQEQVMQIAQELSGYTLGAADLLRRAMGKKIKEEMAAQRQIFVDGAVERGVEQGKASEIFDLVDKFAGYGFNKSHAAAYALVAYQTAYLKANYPVEFMAALMTYDMHNTDKLAAFRQELDRLKLELLPPEVNASDVTFTVETRPGGGKAVRYALAAIKNVGRSAMESLMEERRSGGPFRDLFDFARRIDARQLNKRQIENLARAGVFDGLNSDRAQVYAASDLILRHASAAAEERASPQVSLFGDDPGGSGTRFSLPSVTPWTDTETLAHEFDAIGFYLSAHPLDSYHRYFERLRVHRLADLSKRLGRGDSIVRIAGTVVSKQERRSAKGNRYAFVTVSDSSAQQEFTVFSETLAAARDLLDSGQPLLITAEARVEDGEPRLTAQRIESLDAVLRNSAAGLYIFVDEAAPLARLRQSLERESGGKGEVTLILDLDRVREVEIKLPGRYAISPPVAAMLKTIPGVQEVREV